MSGGRWGYQQFKLEEQGDRLKGLFDFLAVVEHEVDWAVCADTCQKCCRNRLFEAIQHYFDGNFTAAIAIMRDSRQNLCEEDEKREADRRALGVRS